MLYKYSWREKKRIGNTFHNYVFKLEFYIQPVAYDDDKGQKVFGLFA